MRVLLVEDDIVLGRAVQQGLDESGVDCHWVTSGLAGWEQAKSQKDDVIILDLLLPDLPGLDLLQKIRSVGMQTPILILSALGSVSERVRGLEEGGDDYLVKPFAFTELLARLHAISRRSQQRNSPTMEVGPLRLDISSRKVSRASQELALSPTEFSLLEFLMRHVGQVVTRKMLCEHLWDADWEGVTNVIEVHINRLRSKIDRGFDPPLLHTVRGRGYVLRLEEKPEHHF